MSWPVALFDLDGTLTDPEEGIVNCIRHAYQALGREPPAQLRSWIGPPLKQSFHRALGDEALAEQAVKLYRDRFADIGLYENSLVPGIRELLEHLNRRGVRCYVVTSKPTVYATRIVEHFGLTDQFSAVYGSELGGRLTDKAELIAHVLECERIAPGNAVMIGDRHHDIAGARANSVAALAVAWGFGDSDEFGDAHGVADSVDRLGGYWLELPACAN